MSSRQSSPQPGGTASSAAISAFLRGVERRAMVLADLQTGDPNAAETTLAASMRAFLMRASNKPMADWPERFWALLVAVPRLRQPLVAPAAWAAGLQCLGDMPVQPRMALLLRLVAGLEEEQAAAAMGLFLSGYRQALAQACPRDAQGLPDADAWRALANAVQQQVREIPPDRLAHLSALRDAAIAGVSMVRSTPPVSAPRAPVARRHAGWRWVVAVAAFCAIALGATYFRAPSLRPEDAITSENAMRVVEHGLVQVEALPEGTPPPAAAAASGSPDAAMLADPAGMALARDADLYAWYVAGAPVPKDEASAPTAEAADVPETGEANDAMF